MAQSERRTLSITAKLVDLFTRPLGKAQGSFVAFSKSVQSAAKSILDRVFNLKTAVLGLVTSFVSLSTIKAFGEQADALIKLADSTGDTIANISELQAAFDLAGVKAESFDTVLRALLTQARKAQTDGTDKLAQSFADLGVSIDDLQRLGPAQLFEKIAGGLEQFSTAQEKALALGKVLPKQFLDLLPILGGGLQKFQDAIREARAAGATVTDDEARNAERLNDALSKVEKSIGSVARTIIVAFGPQTSQFLERLSAAIAANRDQFAAIAVSIGKGIAAAIDVAITAIIGLIEAVEKISPVSLIEPPAELKAKLERSQQFVDQAKFRLQSARGTPEEERLEREFKATLFRQRQLYDQLENFSLANFLRKTRAALSSEVEKATSLVAPTAGPGAGSVFEPAFGPPLPDTTPLEDGLERAAESAKQVKTNLREALPREAFGGSFWDGFNKGADEAIVSLTDFSAAGEFAAQQLITGGFNGLSDAFADVIMGTKSAKQAFRDFALSMLSDLSRLIARMIILNALQAGFGGFFGGGGGTPAAAGGGGAAIGAGGAPTKSLGLGGGASLAAESRSAPVVLMGAGGGTNLTFNITAVDGKDVQRMLIDQRQTISAIWQNDLKSVAGSRNLVKAAAR